MTKSTIAAMQAKQLSVRKLGLDEASSLTPNELPNFPLTFDMERNMCASLRKISCALAISFLAATGMPIISHAALEDYVFVVVQPRMKVSKDAVIAVRLLHKPTGKPVADAVIFQTRLDMSPDGMGDMVTKVSPLKSDEPGVYRFKADMSMAGGYALNLAAKVPGEAETVRAKLVIEATK